MKKLSIEQMEKVNAGSCTGAILTAVGCALLVGAATYVNPTIWFSPKTWFAASTIIAGNAMNIDSEC